MTSKFHSLFKSSNSFCHMQMGWLMLLIVFLTPNFVHGIEVKAGIGANTIPVGGYTYLSINVEGSTRAEVELPQVSGLILRDSGTSQNTSIVNGRISKSAIVRVTIIGDEEGIFTIPSIPVKVENETFQTNPITVTVTNTPTSTANAGANQNPNASETLTAQDIQKISRIALLVDQDLVFVGQKVPITIELWVNTAHRFDNLSAPAIEDEHILMETLGQNYARTIQYDDDDRFEVYTWRSSFTPLKEGTIQLQSETEVTVLVRARRRTSAFDSMFDSDFFSPSYRRIPLLIKSKKLDLEIRQLPADEKPEGFSGALGKFSMTVEANPKSVKLGDPITLDIQIAGEGNFDRVFHQGLPDGAGFKTYTPESGFEADPSNFLKGVKNFKQAIIPNSAEVKEIPPIEFAYFDTDSGSYQSLTSPAIPIAVELNPKADNSNYNNTNQSPTTGLNAVATDGWIPIQLDLDESHASLSPVILNPRTWVMLALSPTTLLLISFLLPAAISRRRKTRQQKLAGLKRRLKQIEKELNQAQNEDDHSKFIEHAAQYTREILGTLWDVTPKSITLADARSRLGAQLPCVKEIMQLHDSMQYAGGLTAGVEIRVKRTALESEWKQLIASVEQK